MADEVTPTSLMANIVESINREVKYLTAIADEITAGTYTPKKAKDDIENIYFSEGFDLLSLLESLAEFANE